MDSSAKVRTQYIVDKKIIVPQDGDYTAHEDAEGRFYCRAVHGLLSYREDQQVCGMGCPCFAGVDSCGYPVCRYHGVKKAGSPAEQYHMLQQEIASGRAPLFPVTERLGGLYHAYAYAARAHRGQTRKGTQIPYLTHLVTTLNYCMQLTADTEVLGAAVLHDTLEDTNTSYADLRREFGAVIADYVQSETEDKREELPAADTWELRKSETIAHLQEAGREVKMLVLSDKTANAESMVREWRRMGDALWSKFNQPDKTKQAWYYRSCKEALSEFAGTRVMSCLENYIRELFG